MQELKEKDVRVVPFETPKRPVTDQYHGVTVVDDYRWLEDLNDPEVRDWNDNQNGHTREVLKGLPARELIRERVAALYSSSSADYLAVQFQGGRFFALKFQPPKEQKYLVTLGTVDDTSGEKTIVDPNKLDRQGITSIDWYTPSLDGRLIAVSLSKGGSEEGTLHIYEVESGRELSDFIPRVNFPTAGGSAAWNADGNGLYYTRYPRGGERPLEDINFYQQIYFHQLGRPTGEDRYVIGEEFPRIAEIKLSTSEDGSYLLATVANGDGGEFAHYMMDETGRWTQVTQFADQVTGAELGRDGYLYLLSKKNTPKGSILKIPIADPHLSQGRTIVEEGSGSIEGFEPTTTRLYVVEVDGGPSLVRVYDLEGQVQKPIPVEPVSSVGNLLGLQGDEVLFREESFITPPAWYKYDPASGKAVRTGLFVTSPEDFDDCEVVRELATSRDGTRVPLNIIRRKGVRLDSGNPTILGGYGGYGISLKPYFRVRRRVWLDQGGVIAIANLRGGGEYGEEWHRSGNLTRKQNVFDDFVACAKHLMDSGYTSPSRLAIEGGSNGGLLMGVALTQHPEMFQAVVSFVGIYDMLRVELDPNGAFNVTEFGTVKDPEQFRALHAYSPYHHVVYETRYPAVMFLTGENDGRVNPAHSRKMTARLQAATGSGKPILLRTSSTSGHGLDTALNEQIAEDADEFAFLFDQLKVDYAAAGKK